MNRKRRSFLISQIHKQQKWIERCENNERSYTGTNGVAIRQADNNYLHKLEVELIDVLFKRGRYAIKKQS